MKLDSFYKYNEYVFLIIDDILIDYLLITTY
jgi:hypothetical protein